MEFYTQIIRDPRFAREVGNVVIEFGSAARQDVIDRYVAGESVPYTEPRTIWTDTLGWGPTAGYLGFVKFFAQVRATNKTLPPEERIRLWLGEPPLDWAKVESRRSFRYFWARQKRNSHPASIIENLLEPNEKALVIYGGLHFKETSSFMDSSLRQNVEASRPGTFFVVLPYTEIHQPVACARFLEQASGVWPTAALAAPARGGAAASDLRKCATLDEAELVARGLLTLSGVEPSRGRRRLRAVPRPD